MSETKTTGRIVPPVEHEERELHWIAVGDTYDVAEWTGRAWLFTGEAEATTPEHLADLGFRYVALAEPPKENQHG